MNSTSLIERYVANGYGIGLSVGVPGIKPSSDVRVIPLDDFPRVNVGAIWTGTLSPIPALFLEELETQAAEMG